MKIITRFLSAVLALCLLTPLCLLLLLLLGRAAKAKVFETHERAVLLGFAAFYFVIPMALGLHPSGIGQ